MMKICRRVPKIVVSQRTKLRIKDILQEGVSSSLLAAEHNIAGTQIITIKGERGRQDSDVTFDISASVKEQRYNPASLSSSCKRSLPRLASDHLYTSKRKHLGCGKTMDANFHSNNGDQLNEISKTDSTDNQNNREVNTDQDKRLSNSVEIVNTNLMGDNLIEEERVDACNSLKSTEKKSSRRRGRKKHKKRGIKSESPGEDCETDLQSSLNCKTDKKEDSILCKEGEGGALNASQKGSVTRIEGGDTSILLNSDTSVLHDKETCAVVCKSENNYHKVEGSLPTSSNEEGDMCSSKSKSCSKKRNKPNKRRDKRPRPNFFVAIRIKDTATIDKVRKLQEAVIGYDKVFEKALVPIATLHLTLLVFNAESTEEEDLARKALLSCRYTVNDLIHKFSMELAFKGIGTFGGEVIFIKLCDTSGGEIVSKIASELYHAFESHGVRLTDKKKSFTPHLTALKLSRNFEFYRRKKIKQIPLEAYQEFLDDHFGTDAIDSLLLCSMMSKSSDGFYTYIEEMNLVQPGKEELHEEDNERNNDLSSSWDVISTTDIDHAPTPLQTNKPQFKFCTIV